jgi:hypothetical protein
MKKLIYSSLILTAFSLSMVLFQISCQEEADAQAQIYQPIKKRILYTLQKADGTIEYWTARDDGFDYSKLTIEVPASYKLGKDGVFSADGTRLIVSVVDESNFTHIYSFSFDGTMLADKIVDGTGKTDALNTFTVAQAY